MNLIVLKEFEFLNLLDVLLAVVALGAGIYSMVSPKKAWFIFQSKRNKTKEPTEKMIKATKYYGLAIIIMTLVFIYIAFIR